MITITALARVYPRDRMGARRGGDGAALREEQGRVAGVRNNPRVRRPYVPFVVVLWEECYKIVFRTVDFEPFCKGF